MEPTYDIPYSDSLDSPEDYTNKVIQTESSIGSCTLHVGAGFHSTMNEATHRKIAENALEKAREMISAGAPAHVVVTAILQCLENHPTTNAGYGSNLTEDGVVEGDATIVDHFGRAGSVAAVTQVYNPSQVARKVYEQALRGPLSGGRLAPNTLVSDGATEFAYKEGITILPFDAIISASAANRWSVWIKDLNRHTQSSNQSAVDTVMRSSVARNNLRQEHLHTMLEENARIINDNPIEAIYLQIRNPLPGTPIMEVATPPRQTTSPEIPSMVDGLDDEEVTSEDDRMPSFERYSSSEDSHSTAELQQMFRLLPPQRRNIMDVSELSLDDESVNDFHRANLPLTTWPGPSNQWLEQIVTNFMAPYNATENDENSTEYAYHYGSQFLMFGYSHILPHATEDEPENTQTQAEQESHTQTNVDTQTQIALTNLTFATPSSLLGINRARFQDINRITGAQLHTNTQEPSRRTGSIDSLSEFVPVDATFLNPNESTTASNAADPNFLFQIGRCSGLPQLNGAEDNPRLFRSDGTLDRGFIYPPMPAIPVDIATRTRIVRYSSNRLTQRSLSTSDLVTTHRRSPIRRRGAHCRQRSSSLPFALEGIANAIDAADASRGEPTNVSTVDTEERDEINDTVGVIVVDQAGNIACGSSSGGLGMKMKGRAGPAGLPGAGSAVVPADPEDPEGVTVAVVASGTGEYITSTMAATLAAERLYHGMKKIPGGGLQECDDSEALKAFIEKEFLGHASVVHRGDRRAKPVIGLLAIKASRSVVRVYYAHNSPSFCIGSMSLAEVASATSMSRLPARGGEGLVVGGGKVLARHMY